MQVTYTFEGQEQQAEITRVVDGVIYARTLQQNGDWTEEHTLPASEIKQQVRFNAKQVPGKGWTVVLTVGSKRTGREDIKTDFADTYTMHQAQMAADAAQRGA